MTGPKKAGRSERLLALCSLPRRNPGDQKEYVRRNGPYKLGMVAGLGNKLPYGNIPRLLLAWVSTEAGQGKQSRSAGFPPGLSTQVEENQDSLAEPALPDGGGGATALTSAARHRAVAAAPRGITSHVRLAARWPLRMATAAGNGAA